MASVPKPRDQLPQEMLQGDTEGLGDESKNSQRRKVKSREHTVEEKRKNRKEWKKRKREARKAMVKLPSTGDRVILNDHEETPGAQLKEPTSSSQNMNRIILPASDPIKNSQKSPVKTHSWHSRSALMLRLAQGKSQRKTDVKSTSFTTSEQPETTRNQISRPFSQTHHQAQQRLPGPSKPMQTAKKQLVVVKERKLELKELNPQNINYLSRESFGSGSYGQCYRARYRGIDVVVKKMIHKDTEEDKRRAKRELIHEAEVIAAIGDHERLPLMVGVVTSQDPLCLVIQFHGVNDTGINLYQAANTNTITSSECLDIFVEICSALKHVHSKGLLHNDIKANNVVLERNSESDGYTPILIDFGKSTKAAANFPLVASRKRTHDHGKSYLAPEVLKYRQYSSSSDIYSMGRMLKGLSKILGFYHSVRIVVKNATMENPSDRTELDQLVIEIAAIHL